ncbi:hypothetical protein F2P81_019211 [Scophthalmus maximus]|uniref:Uncharacterized protein n=1 Tax=Scophthalmus maximus TaxID=52904 RepID=A0A6A4SBC1_SCOMX|nr:hypothetical protein F2P81_019211 [Scophthalmus maximus]
MGVGVAHSRRHNSFLFSMASPQQSRIQSYLERNRIGPLFEELMTKLITETPDHPIPFLIDHLQTKQDSPGKLHRALSGSAALWAQSSPESKNTRREYSNYEKPWQIHPKKPKKSKSDLAVSSISPPSPESKSLPRSVECPSWDWRESRDFDELSHILQESKKLGKALESLSRSIAISDELDQNLGGYNSMLRPRVVGEWVGREEEDADPLAAEMLRPPVPRAKTEVCWSGDSSPAGSLKMDAKSKGLKEQQQHHKKLLAAMLSQDSFDSVHSPAPSVAEEEIEDEDDAMELLEDLDDLRMEGVTSLAPSGSKFSQGRSSYQAEPQAKVTLNICSRLQGDSLSDSRSEEERRTRVSEQAVPDISCKRSRSRPVTPTSQPTLPRKLLTPPGLSTTDSLGASLRAYLSEDEFYQQLQAIRQPWHIPSDTDSDILEPPEQDKSGARDASKRSVFSEDSDILTLALWRLQRRIFTVLLESSEHGSQSVLVLQISGTLTQFILSISSIEFMSPPVLQLLCQHNVGGSRSSGIRQDEFARGGLQLQPQMSHVDAAPMLLLPLWI